MITLSCCFGKIEMKPIALLIAFCVFCQPAIAQTTECQLIPKARDRLACYDKAAPPIGRGKRVAASPAISPQPYQAVDPLSAENARLNAKINNICRGC
jgi:type II secretory pathway component PulM